SHHGRLIMRSLSPSKSFAVKVSRYETTVAIRCLSAATEVSVSGGDGASLPDARAAANFAVSHDDWTWRTNGNMSGARRHVSIVSASNFLAPANATALSSQPVMFVSIFFISRMDA